MGRALDEAALSQQQAESYGMDELERVGEDFTGQVEIGQDLDVQGILKTIGQRGLDALGEVGKSTVRSCVLLLVVTLLCGLAEGMATGSGGDPMRLTTLVAILSITTIAVGAVHSLLTMGSMEGLGDVLFPAVSMATAASGTPAAAGVKYGITILFSDFLIRLIRRLLIPLCYAYVAAGVAWAALGNEGLKRVGGLLKWLITVILSAVLLVFIGYLNLSGVISDTAETLLAGASILRNAAGVFGMLAVLGICMAPFLNLGLHYLLYKCTAALAATASGDGRVTGLIDQLSTAFGLILAMTGSCAVLLIVAMISAVSTVAG